MFKKVVSTAAATLALVGGASAATQYSAPVTGSTFSDLLVGTINIATTSNLSGDLFAADSITFQTFAGMVTLSLDSVTFTLGTVGSPVLTDADPSSAGFSFTNVPMGNYEVRASGYLTSDGQIHNLAVIGTNYTIAAVPEPTAAAMLLAGLAVMGFIAMRRRQD